MQPVMKSKLLRLLRTVAVCYLLLCVLIGLLQRFLIYMPFHETEPALLVQASGLGVEPWRDASGAIIGWKSAPPAGPPPANRLVVFHGNAGYALHREYYFSGFGDLDDGRTWEVLIFEYPGYGARPGKIGEASFVEAATKALDTLAADPRPIFLLGESLGSGPACALAARHPQRIAGLFLVTPFASLRGVASHHYPFLPVRFLLRDQWDNTAALRNYAGRVAVLIADKDEVVTAAQGRQLFEAYTGPKRLWTERGARHNDVNFSPTADWWREVTEFLLAASAPALSPP
jgi:pimeloyl-ACP methyl ester carboxylesterase